MWGGDSQEDPLAPDMSPSNLGLARTGGIMGRIDPQIDLNSPMILVGSLSQAQIE